MSKCFWPVLEHYWERRCSIDRNEIINLHQRFIKNQLFLRHRGLLYINAFSTERSVLF